ncbi:type II toxin-antitoxin system RelE/ParE family toxin [Candidatus Azambacteria bacterium]|nr:type II toxin-antitoxin system RelE/ParE family toxin [Candidatus Azambacteria bacterium]
MTYCVVIPKKTQKDLDKIDKRYRDRVVDALSVLSLDPYAGKNLAGEYKEKYSYRVWPYRIIYEIYKKELVILIIRIGHRQGVYGKQRK